MSVHEGLAPRRGQIPKHRPLERRAAMTRFFNSPFLLGFENLEKLLERTAKHAGEGYPPYNIESTPEGAIAITLAVAGFARDQLAVTVEENQLVIRGRSP